MRVRFEWEADPSLDLPISYHQILQGIIYYNLQTQYEYSNFVHNEGYMYGQRSFRMFCFSHISGKGYAHNKRIEFTGPISFEVSSPDVYLIRTLADNVEKEGLKFGDTHYKNIRVKLSDYEVDKNEIIVEMMSPIVVSETNPDTKKRIYFSPQEKAFATAVQQNFLRKYEAYYGVSANGTIEIEPVKVTEKDKCVTTYKNTYITGYEGMYRLKGERKYLNFLYQAGIGSKNAQGFGMSKVLL